MFDPHDREDGVIQGFVRTEADLQRIIEFIQIRVKCAQQTNQKLASQRTCKNKISELAGDAAKLTEREEKAEEWRDANETRGREERRNNEYINFPSWRWRRI
jgi:hypothetical protein